MRVDVVSIFPDYLAPLELSLIGKARQDGLLELNVHDLRDFTTDRHRTVDDTPYGGGAGMVLKHEPWAQALAALARKLWRPAFQQMAREATKAYQQDQRDGDGSMRMRFGVYYYADYGPFDSVVATGPSRHPPGDRLRNNVGAGGRLAGASRVRIPFESG